ncbi:hypoxanthine phosphoribosyltransferase [Fibrobacter sp. UWEL]|uniref:hypoxanthine phosphoribosyltransferase n=1 Tax=Fibrobacter sp. UWEL TaxID=1896209 RepID=UPI0009238B6F|nr:hypoxanthine phosphoribosyltransferase [Fibrobacter sp. UWEL]SHK62419.1 hypoxanthine phosphoribosyltransferase [Fibrobacter sp. UWEL]
MYKMSAKPMISAKQIQTRVKDLATEINSTFEFDVILSALTGAFMFTTDLCRAMANFKHRIAFIKASSYGSGMESSGKLKVTGLEKLDLKGKRVLIVDDILDTGRTMSTLVSMLKEAGATDIRTCVLMNKEERRSVDFHADYVGFEIANEFVVGYGLDFDEDYRTLPEVWTLEEV